MKLLIVALVVTFAAFVAASAIYAVGSAEEFDEQLLNAGNKLVVADFFAEWCNSCRDIAPHLETLAQKYTDKIIIIKVDVDELYDLSDQYKVTSMPTFVFLKNNVEVEPFSGANKEKLENIIRKHID